MIVMITRLVEGEGSKRRKKADCYWPDRKVIMVELGMMVLAMAFVMMVSTGRLCSTPGNAIDRVKRCSRWTW